jgi:hypothetical protein
MRSYKYIPALLVTLAAIAAGCSSTTEPPAPSSNVSFTQNAKFTYAEQRRDTTGGTYGYDNPDPTSTDSVHSTVIDTNANAYGKSHVVVIYNKRSRNADDTTYIWQDGQGNVYRYNYGVDILNNIPAVIGFLGHRIEVGWVLQSKMSSSVGTAWIAGRDTETVTLPIIGLTSIYVTDSATRVSDTTISVNGSAVSAVHTEHRVKLYMDAAIISVVRIDNYESKSYGEVRNTVHSFTATVPLFASAQVSGQERMMVSHQ